jgi:hypothetical protein
VAQLGHRLGLDLPDPLPGDPVDLTDLAQGRAVALCEAGQARSLIPVGQIARVSSSKAARTRRFTVFSVLSS